MQRLTKRMVALAACIVFVLSMSITSFAADSEIVRKDGFSSCDGLEIKTTTDSDEYKDGEAIEYTITITNTNDYALDDVYLTYKFPEGIEYDKLEMKKYENVGDMAAGEVKTITFSTEGEPHSDSIFSSLTSGDPVAIAIVAGIAVAVIAVIVIIIVVIKKKKAKKTVSMMLVGVLLAGSISMGFTEETQAAVTNSNYSYAGVHDPSIVQDPETGTYYLFGSHLSFAKSDDLMKWSKLTLNLNSDYDELFGDVWNNYCTTPKNSVLYSATGGSNLWAPDVIWNETMQKWCMYMSVNGNDWHSAIVLLTADDIEGPYEYVDEVIFSGFDGSADGEVQGSLFKAEKTVTYNDADAQLVVTVTFAPHQETPTRAEYSDIKQVLGLEDSDPVPSRYKSTDQAEVNCIDPNVCYDEDGNLWMTYGSWSAGIYQIKLDNETGLRDYDYNEYGEYKKDGNDPYLGYKIAGGYYNSGEGPYILSAGGYYYLFVSLGNLETDGGYNMRLFRSESINGPYVDQDGNNAIYTGFDSKAGFVSKDDTTTTSKYNSIRGIRVMSSIKMYGKSTTHVEAAQGHNSAFVDEKTGKIFLVYHTRFTDTGEAFSARVHQMYVNEDGWLVVSPYEYSGETLSTTGFTATDIAGTYDLSIQYRDKVYTSKSKDADKGIYTAVSITLGADGTISGAATGTWKTTTGSNVEMVIDGETYKGVFVKQANETERKDTLTFTLCGNNQMVWGAKTN
ncbi:MAG: glycoside hydrolase family 43 protein [Lachnospiraceae bacterium]|nr:glycoside hydrolase family 43 protein [Lachnospiraceae bacterium]